MERTPSRISAAVDCRKTRFSGGQRLVFGERGRPFVEREEREELRGEPFAQQRLPRGEIEQPGFVEPRDRRRSDRRRTSLRGAFGGDRRPRAHEESRPASPPAALDAAMTSSPCDQ